MRFIGCRPKARKSCFILWITVAGAGWGERRRAQRHGAANFASTEDLEKHFLATFIRRIPVIVKILPIAERGQFERLAFIHHFFRREAQRLNHDLELDGEIVSQLMRETLEGNVGGLENLIRNICASAWTFGERDSGLLHIKAGLLPDRLLADAPFTLQQNSERVMIYRDGDAQPLFLVVTMNTNG